MYILINLLSIIDSKGRLYYDTKSFNRQTLLHQLTIINNISNKKPLINRQYLSHAVLKKNKKHTFTPLLQPLKQLLTPRLPFTAKAVGVGRDKALGDLLVVIAEDMAVGDDELLEGQRLVGLELIHSCPCENAVTDM